MKSGVEIKFNNIGKKYEGNINYTLDGINFLIAPNDFCVLLGPSGCGKTTLLRMVAGLNSITKGDLLFNGKRVNDLPPKSRDIAMVFQSYALYPHMNVYKNMSFSLELAHFKKDVIHRRVVDAAKLLNIHDYLYSKPAALSGGQRQRVALGRAIVRRPGIFLMDEPLSNLDAKLRETMRTELVQIHKTLGSTTIYVTHDQLEAMTMATKIILLNNSVIQQMGNPRDLYDRPANTFVAKFIGTPSMNLFRGTLKNGEFVYDDWKNDSSFFKIKIDNDTYHHLTKNNHSKITLGIRTEHVYPDVRGPIKAFVNSVELLGKEKEIKAKILPETELVATTSVEQQVREDQYEYFNFNQNNFHFFDIKGRRI